MADSGPAQETKTPGKIGLHLPVTLSDIPELARAAESAGVNAINMPDSPLLYPDVYMSCAVSMLATSEIGIHTGVTNPVTRHPSVTAGTARSLSQLGPNRTAIGIATGDSACWGVGLKGARIAELCEYVVALKSLLRGEEATWRGVSFRGHWPDLDPSLAPPVYVACSGPKILRAAAEVADGAIVTMGFSPEAIDYVKGIVAEGLAASGRTDKDFEIWWNAHITFDESHEAAASRSLGWSPSWLTMGSLEGKGIPDEYKEKLLELNEDTHNLNATYKSKNREQTVVDRAKKLGLYDWLLTRSPRLFGTSDDVAARLNELGRDHDMKKWIFFATGRGERASANNGERLAYIDQLTGEVRPQLK